MARLNLNIQPIRACGKKRHYSLDEAHRHRDQLASMTAAFVPPPHH